MIPRPAVAMLPLCVLAWLMACATPGERHPSRATSERAPPAPPAAPAPQPRTADEESRQQAGEFLVEEVKRAEAHRAAVCRETEEVSARCALLIDEQEAARRCQRSKDSAACRAAKAELMDRAKCEIEKEHVKRNCDLAESSVRLTRAKLAELERPAPRQ